MTWGSDLLKTIYYCCIGLRQRSRVWDDKISRVAPGWMSSSGVKSTAFGAGRQAGEFQSSGMAGHCPAHQMEGEDCVFGRQKQAKRRQSELLLLTCDSKNVSQEHVWGPAGGTEV